MIQENPWLTYPKPNPKANLRLFCFPYAGAGTSIFRLWSNQLPSEIEVCAVQLPGRERRFRETPLTQLSPLVQTLTQALLPSLDRPFTFFGHSMGALITFELARQLRRQNLPTPSQLFISGRRAPKIPCPKPLIHKLPDAAFLEELRLKGGTPEAVLKNPELMQLFLPILRADLGINETYTYTTEPPFDCPIWAFGGLQDPEVSREELAAWREETTSSFALQMFPGNHFFLNQVRAPLLQTISEKLRSHFLLSDLGF